jgi:type I restriction enzyme M protein
MWLRDESLNDAKDLQEPEVLATEAIEELEIALEDLQLIVKALGDEYE